MSQLSGVVGKLFQMPHEACSASTEILGLAADAHEELLLRACAMSSSPPVSTLEILCGLLPEKNLRRPLFCLPLMIESLHGLAAENDVLNLWHNATAVPSATEPSPVEIVGREHILGNILFGLEMRSNCPQFDDVLLATDIVGRLRFPFCDWSISFWSPAAGSQRAVLGQRFVASLTDESVQWSQVGGQVSPVLRMSRDDCCRMVARNDEQLDANCFVAPDALLRPKLQYAARLCDSNVRYDPIYFEDFEGHASVTGAILQQLLIAIRQNSPDIYEEFTCFTHTIRGFELPASERGIVQSFSDPTTPGIVGFNVSYSEDDQPCLSPYCFLSLGHELAHTKCYLIDTIVYREGWTFLRNGSEWTKSIGRYGRPLSVRTLFQNPYAHIYEWSLLMDFIEAGFRQVAWDVDKDPVPVGEDLMAEIEEAFDLISSYTRLTRLGEAARSHFWKLFLCAKSRWRNILRRPHHMNLSSSV